MRFQVLIYFCLTLCIGIHGRRLRIVGGENADVIDFPHMVSLRYYSENKHFCGGSIISNWHILTAGHCLLPIQHEYNDVRIYSGLSSSRSTSGQSYGIANVIIHPQYQGTKSVTSMEHHDIAIIKVTKYIYFNEFQKQIELPTDDIYEGIIGILTGWGQTMNPGETSEQLQKASMRIYHNANCSPYVPFALKNEQFCAFHKIGIGACTGDSGSPLIHDGKIIGIISFTVPCALGYPDIYTNIYSYIKFIRTVIKK